MFNSRMTDDLARHIQEVKSDPSDTGKVDPSVAFWQNVNPGSIPEIEQYLSDHGMSELVQANPYKNVNYRQSPWQKFLSTRLGLRTGYDTAMEQADIQSKEYLYSLLQQQWQNEYNDPAAQAARMRKAGMNPDLLGTEGVAESATPPADNSVMSPDTFAPDQLPVQEIVSTASMAFGALESAVGSALTVAQSLQSLNAGRLANSQSALETAFSFLEKTQNADLLGDRHEFDSFFDRLPLSRKQKKQMGPLLYAMRDSLLSRKSEKANAVDYGTNRGIVARQLNNVFQNPHWLSDQQMFDSDSIVLLSEFEQSCQRKMAEINSKMYDLQFKKMRVQELSTENDERQELARQGLNFDAQVQLSNEQTQNLIREQNAITKVDQQSGLFYGRYSNMAYQNQINKLKMDWDKFFTESKNEMLDKIRKRANDGKWFDKALLIAITASGFITDSGLGQLAGSVASGVSGFNLPERRSQPDFNSNFEVQPLPQWNF